MDPQESSSQELLIEKEPPVNIDASDLSNIEARGVEDVASTPVRRGTRIRVPSRKILDNMAAEESHQILKIQSSTKPIPNPKNDEEALNGPYAEEWLEADRAEINHMLSRNLWKVVPKSSVPPGKRIIGCRFERVVKWKVENPTEVEKFKSRLVAQGYNMRMGIDFSKKFAKVVRIESVMLILAVMNHYDLNHNTYDIKAFFLHGDSEEEVYIRQPPGFETHNKNDFVCLLKHSMYGVPQAHREANKKLHSVLAESGLEPMKVDSQVWWTKSSEGLVLTGWHVDDSQSVFSSNALMAKIEAVWSRHFEIKKTTDPTSYLGLNIIRDREKRSVDIRQDNNVQDFIVATGMEKANAVTTPMLKSPSQLDRALSEQLDEQGQQIYMQLIGRLIWLLHTRYDAAQAIGSLSRSTKKATVDDLKAVKHLARYFKGRPKLGIRIVATSHPELTFWMRCDASFLDQAKSKSTLGYQVHLGSPDDHGGVIQARSMRSRLPPHSTMEAESDASMQASNVVLDEELAM